MDGGVGEQALKVKELPLRSKSQRKIFDTWSTLIQFNLAIYKAYCSSFVSFYFSEQQLRIEKENILTDIMCAIPESLEIDTTMQKVDTLGMRIKTWLREELMLNWLKDPWTISIVIMYLMSSIFFLVTLLLPFED